MTPEITLSLSTAVFVIVEVLKKTGINSRLIPPIALAIGAMLGALLIPEWQAGIIQGIIASATAMGIYSGAKALEAKDDFK